MGIHWRGVEQGRCIFCGKETGGKSTTSLSKQVFICLNCYETKDQEEIDDKARRRINNETV